MSKKEEYIKEILDVIKKKYRKTLALLKTISYIWRECKKYTCST